MIKPSGPSTSKVMVYTDFPEAQDFQRGTVFSGKQGWLFEKMLKEINVKKDSLYISSLSWAGLKPDKKKHKNRKALAKLVHDNARSIEDVKQEIQAVDPNVIISVGEFPLQYLTGNEGINQFQGSVLSLNPNLGTTKVKVVPIQHPRDIFKVYKAFYYTPVYLKRAFSYRDDPRPFREKQHLIICKDFNTLRNYLRSYSNSPYIVCDIETYYNLISCIGISLDENSALVIPLVEDLINPNELVEMLKLLQKAFEYFPYVNQNAVFDQIRLERYGFRIRSVLGDTMLNQSVLYPELPKNLGFINSLFTNIPYFKDEGKGYTPSERLYLYCAKDCVSTYQIYKKQMIEAEEVGVKPFIENHLMKFYPVYRDLQTRGIQVDGKKKQELLTKYETMLEMTTVDIEDILGRKINPLSPKQCHELLYDELNLPKQKKRRQDGEYTDTADEDAIEFLLLNHVEDLATRNVLNKIIQCRKVTRILGYLNIPLHEGDIFHTSYNLAGTETGRTSTSKSGDRFYKYVNEKLEQIDLGFALQTIPKHGFELPDGTRIGQDIRSIFVPRNGYIFAEGDQSKAEAVIVTVLAQDWDLYNNFYNVNLHKVTACSVFSAILKKTLTEDDITPDQYNKGKRVRHAGNYDMGEGTLAKQAMCSITVAKQILNAFHETNWKVRGVFQRSIREFLQQNLWLNTPYGRRRDFFVNPNSNSYLREGYAYIPQSVVSDKTKIAMYETLDICKARKLDMFFLGESHDSVLAEVREGQEIDYLSILKERIEQPIDMRKCCIPRDIDAVIRFECTTGYTWKDQKEVSV